MSKYGSVAGIAAHLIRGGRYADPREAWTAAAEMVFERSSSSVAKGCPRDTFLALCGAGVIEGVAEGQYTRSVANKAYALRALDILRQEPDLMENLNQLWSMACGDSSKRHNAQMDVVRELWHRRWIR